MKTPGNTPGGVNPGHIQRNALFMPATPANPVKTISQINFDVSGCQKFLPPGVKAVIEMDHTSDEYRYIEPTDAVLHV